MPHDVEPGMQTLLASFNNPEHVKQYGEGPQKFVPGASDLHKMTGLLLAERAPDDGRVLVLGAGGGRELRDLADMQPGWSFVGVDPAGAMLEEARRVLGDDAGRAELVEGYIEDAPDGPFDGGVCLLTLHFLQRDERLRTLWEIRRRLKTGAPFVAAHSAFPPGDRDLWLSRYAAFAVASGADPEQVDNMKAVVKANLPMLDSVMDETLMSEAGFSDVTLFYAGFTWRGWVAYA